MFVEKIIILGKFIYSFYLFEINVQCTEQQIHCTYSRLQPKRPQQTAPGQTEERSQAVPPRHPTWWPYLRCPLFLPTCTSRELNWSQRQDSIPSTLLFNAGVLSGGVTHCTTTLALILLPCYTCQISLPHFTTIIIYWGNYYSF